MPLFGLYSHDLIFLSVLRCSHHSLQNDLQTYGVKRVLLAHRVNPGMVLTIEPGLYIAPDADVPQEYRGIGIRIEDDIVITETGNENLTAMVVKDPDEIEALMAGKI